MPWDVERMTPEELGRFYEGWLWRRSRNMRVLGIAIGWVGWLLDKEIDDEMVAQSFPGYTEE